MGFVFSDRVKEIFCSYLKYWENIKNKILKNVVMYI